MMRPPKAAKATGKNREHLDRINADGGAAVSVALGYEVVEGLDIESAVQMADRKTYLDKAMKKKSQDGSTGL